MNIDMLSELYPGFIDDIYNVEEDTTALLYDRLMSVCGINVIHHIYRWSLLEDYTMEISVFDPEMTDESLYYNEAINEHDIRIEEWREEYDGKTQRYASSTN